MKIHLIFILLLMASCGNVRSTVEEGNAVTKEERTDKEAHISQEECSRLKGYCLRKGFNPDVCILVDFSEYSGNERLYIYNLKHNCIEASGRVAHGIGKKGIFAKAYFSNVPESWESSLGRYRIGRSRTLNIPEFTNVPCLEVHGLDPTNSNAHKRGIVIHPGLLTSGKTVTPCEPFSKGCFTVGQDTFQAIESLTRQSSKPILLYAYN